MPDRERDRPWVFRTYSGHTSAAASNALYKKNLAKGQTGLSIAFDLPTQTGYDADAPQAFGEVGKVGVPVSSIADMHTLCDGIPLESMNTSMTINATAAWLLALYVAVAEDQGADLSKLSGTTQNDIQKEYLSRGTFIFPPAASLRLTVDTIVYTVNHMPKWNPVNVCPYHLQEAGATPEQELAFGLAMAIQILDAVRESGQVAPEDFGRVCGAISFFNDTSIRFVEEVCKMRAFRRMWDGLLLERYGIEDPRMRRYRYGVQVNSLGLTEQQPENNVQRIVLEMLGVTLSRDARCRALQLPAWNEALGLPTPWDQQWSLRMQQVLAYETDLLEYDDIFEGSHVIEAKTDQLVAEAAEELARIDEMGGMLVAIDTGYVKSRLVESNARRVAAIESGEKVVVGVNMFTEAEPNPLLAGESVAFMTPHPEAEADQVRRLGELRVTRDGARVADALAELRETAESAGNIMLPSIRCAHAGVTTGEWAGTLRAVFGEYRAPTGLAGAASVVAGGDALRTLRSTVAATSRDLGRPLKLLIGKPGLDGHSNGAEQIALRARDAGFEVVYQGIRLSPGQIASAALEESVHAVGLSVLSGSHMELVPEVLRLLDDMGLVDVPVFVGGIIPDDDAGVLRKLGVAGVYTPKDFRVSEMLAELIQVVRASHGLPAAVSGDGGGAGDALGETAGP
ncbi:MAG: protein meaA [Acidimicrobiia bacterium]|nr:protein meaA [Acidimicrobiia bacterium]